MPLELSKKALSVQLVEVGGLVVLMQVGAALMQAVLVQAVLVQAVLMLTEEGQTLPGVQMMLSGARQSLLVQVLEAVLRGLVKHPEVLVVPVRAPARGLRLARWSARAEPGCGVEP